MPYEIFCVKVKQWVDFSYEADGKVYQYSLAGGEKMLLSELLEVLGILEGTPFESAADFISHIETVAFSDTSLVKVTPVREADFSDGDTKVTDWELESLQAFDTEETLTITMDNGDEITVKVTDAQDGTARTTDLANLLEDATITINGRTLGNELWTVKEGETYTIHLAFKEIANLLQFDMTSSEPLTYTLPDGFNADLNTGGTFTLKDNHGNEYAGNNYYILNGVLYVELSSDAKTAVAEAGDTEIILDITGKFTGSTNTIVFSDGVTRTVDIDDGHDLRLNKTGYYDQADDKVHYTVTVYSDGRSENVVVKDTITGTALTFDKNVAVNGASSSYNIVNSNDGFEVQIPFMSDGETITITYTASVDHTKLTGKGEQGQTENSVTVKGTNVPEDPDDKTSTDLNGKIDYQPLSKSAGSVSDVYEENGEKYRTVDWTIVVNKEMAESMAGKTLTDTIGEASQSIMDYSGNVEVKVYSSSDESILVRTDSVTPGTDTWTYTFPTADGNYWYKFTYKTKVKVTGEVTSTNVTNTVTDDEHTITTGTDVGPGESVNLTKTAASVSDKEISWQITFDVPKSGLDQAVVTDTYPTTWGIYFDTLKEGSVSVKMSTDGGEASDYDSSLYSVVNDADNHQLLITFYQDASHNTAGFATSDRDRQIIITLTTENDENWVKAFPVSYDATSATHTNNVNLNNIFFDSASATPVSKMITKSAFEAGTVTIADVEYPVYRYDITIQGLNGELSLTDSYDTNLQYFDIRRTDYTPAIDGYWGERLFDSYWEGARTYVAGETNNNGTTYTENQLKITDNGEGKLTFNCAADDVPKDGKGYYYNSYQIIYYMIPKDMSALQQAALRANGKLSMGNTITWEDNGTSNANVIYEYPGLKKNELHDGDAGYSLTGDEVSKNYAQFEIILNPNCEQLHGGTPMTMTDTYENLSVDYSSITIKAYDASGNEIPPDPAIAYNYSGNTGTFKNIPDSTKVVITYKARIVGDTGDLVTFKNVATMEGYTDSASGEKTINSEASAGLHTYSIRLFKYEQGDMTSPLSGAVFTLTDKDGNPILYPSSATRWVNDAGETVAANTEGAHSVVGYPVTFTTGSNGYVDISLNQQLDGISLQKDVTYYLKETTAPRTASQAYQLDRIIYRFTITENPDYSKYEYYDGDIMKVSNKPARGVLEIDKDIIVKSGETVLTGYSLTEEQKKEITFTISAAQLDEPGRTFTPITITYADFVNGTYRLEDLEPGTYDVVETRFNIDGYNHEDTIVDKYHYMVAADGTHYYDDTEDHQTHTGDEFDGEDDLQQRVVIEEIHIEQGVEHKVEYKNMYTTTGVPITVKKASMDNVALYGAVFQLLKYDGLTNEYVAYTEGALANTKDTDREGVFTIGYENRATGVTITGLTGGDYKLIELVAPEGYKSTEEAFYFRVSGTTITRISNDGTETSLISIDVGQTPAVATVKNELSHAYTIIKAEKGRLDALLSGAVFSVYEYSSSGTDTKLFDLAGTDINGKTVLDWEAGYTIDGTQYSYDNTKLYYVMETTPPAGYKKNTEKYYFYNSNGLTAEQISGFASTNGLASKNAVNLGSGDAEVVVTDEVEKTYISVEKQWKNWDESWIENPPVNSIQFRVVQYANTTEWMYGKWNSATESFDEVEEGTEGGNWVWAYKETTTSYYPDDTTIYTITGGGADWIADSVVTGLPTGTAEDGVQAYYSYDIEEVNVPDGYLAVYNQDNLGNVRKIVTNKPEPANLTVTKVYSENTPSSYKNSVQVQLCVDMPEGGTAENWYVTHATNAQVPEGKTWIPVGQAQVLNADNNWTYTFENLVKGQTYHVLEYHVDENNFDISVSNDNTFVAGTDKQATVTNTYKLIDITVYKKWVATPASDQSQVYVSLYREVLDNENTSGKTVVNINGKECVLYNDGWSDYKDWFTTNNTCTFTGLPSTYIYHVIETAVTGKDFDNYTVIYDSANENGLSAGTTNETTITNILKDETALAVYKIWDDNDNESGERPESIQVSLLKTQGGTTETAGTVTLNDSNNWYYKWTGLDSGYTYTVNEPEIDGYAASVSYDNVNGTAGIITITNTKTDSDTTRVRVEKNWKTENGTDWPVDVPSVTMTLYANGVSTGKTVVLTVDNQTDAWENLDKYDANGNRITYTVYEGVVNGYSVFCTDAAGGLVSGRYATPVNGKASFTNVQTTTTISTEKNWSGLTNAKVSVAGDTEGTTVEKELTDYLTVVLYLDRYNADGSIDNSFNATGKYGPIYVKASEVTAENWKKDWGNLPYADAAGNAFTYKVREADVILSDDVVDSELLEIPETSPRSVKDQFTTVISEDNATVTNTYESPYAQLTITKNVVGLDSLTDDQKKQISFTVSGLGFTAQTKTLYEMYDSSTGTYSWTLTKADGIRKKVEYTVTETNNLSVSGKVVSTSYTVTADGTTQDGNGNIAKITMNTSDSGTVAYTNRYQEPEAGDGELEIRKEWGSAFTDSDKRTVKVGLYRREMSEKPSSGSGDNEGPDEEKTINLEFYWNGASSPNDTDTVTAKVGDTISVTISSSEYAEFTGNDQNTTNHSYNFSIRNYSTTFELKFTGPSHSGYTWKFYGYTYSSGNVSISAENKNAGGGSSVGNTDNVLYVDSTLKTQAQVVSAGGQVVPGYEVIEISSAAGWKRVITGLPTTNGKEGDELRYYVYYIVEENGDVYGATYDGTNGSLTVKNNNKPTFTDITVEKKWRTQNGEEVTDNPNRTGSAQFELWQVVTRKGSTVGENPVKIKICDFNREADGNLGGDIVLTFKVTIVEDDSQDPDKYRKIFRDDLNSNVRLYARYYSEENYSGSGSYQKEFHPTIISELTGGETGYIIQYTIPTQPDGINFVPKSIDTTSYSWQNHNGTFSLYGEPDLATGTIQESTSERLYASFVLSSDENWMKVFNDLPKTSADGKTSYTYYVKEINPENSIKTITYSPSKEGDETRSDEVSAGTITVTNTEEVTTFTVQKRWQDADNHWNADYGQDLTIYFKLYKVQKDEDGTILERAQVDTSGSVITSGGVYTLTKNDTVDIPEANLATNDDGVERGVVATHFTKTGNTYAIPFMKSFTLPKLAAGWDYIAVECMADGTEFTENTEYWTCFEFANTTYTIKNDLKDIHVTKTWNIPQTGTYYHPAVTFTLYRKEVDRSQVGTEENQKANVAKVLMGMTVEGVTAEGYTPVADVEAITMEAGQITYDTREVLASWDNLPKFNIENGKEYVYVVIEGTVAEPYSFENATVNTDSWGFSNKLDYVNLWVYKQWYDKEGTQITSYNDLPESVAFHVWQVGYSDASRTVIKSQPVDITPEAGYTITKPTNAEDKWLKVVDNLPKASIDVNGDTTYFGYFVTEDGVDGYRATYQTETNDSVETSAPSNAVVTDFPNGNNGGTIIKNTAFEISIDIVKVDAASKETTLSGAKFRLEKYTGVTFRAKDTSFSEEEKTTGQDGKITFTGLSQGYYKLVETQVPTGYIKTSGDATFRIYADANNNILIELLNSANRTVTYEAAVTADSANNVEARNATFTVTNEPGIALPSTGGPGTRMMYLVGALLTVTAALLLARRQRSR